MDYMEPIPLYDVSPGYAHQHSHSWPSHAPRHPDMWYSNGAYYPQQYGPGYINPFEPVWYTDGYYSYCYYPEYNQYPDYSYDPSGEPIPWQYASASECTHETPTKPEPTGIELSAYATALHARLQQEQSQVRAASPVQISFAEALRPKFLNSAASAAPAAGLAPAIELKSETPAAQYAITRRNSINNFPVPAVASIPASPAAGTEARRRMDEAKAAAALEAEVQAMLEATFASSTSADVIRYRRLRHKLKKAAKSAVKERKAKEKQLKEEEERMKHKE